MSVYCHVAVGAALGAVAPSPGAALVLGAAAHVPADLLSHHDFNRAVELLLAAAALFLYTWLGDFRLAIILGAIGGAAPDIENLILGRRGGTPRRFFPSHADLLRHGGARGRWDTAVQLGVAAVMAAWVVWAPGFW
jgi:hypothetical protein